MLPTINVYLREWFIPLIKCFIFFYCFLYSSLLTAIPSVIGEYHENDKCEKTEF